jgi:hypothetical protein
MPNESDAFQSHIFCTWLRIIEARTDVAIPFLPQFCHKPKKNKSENLGPMRVTADSQIVANFLDFGGLW